MPIKVVNGIRLPHTCPQCNTTVATLSDLRALFGTRKIRLVGYKKEIAQSWCKSCRANQQSGEE